MSQDFMDPELFADFIIEAKEHLETIEPNLLELEKSPDNLALLNEIFRPMHSLKGASGFLGLNKINHLAHKAENILDELRKGEMVVTSEIMDVILSATDALSQMIDNLEKTSSEGDVETTSIMNLIDAIMNGELHSSTSIDQATQEIYNNDSESDSLLTSEVDEVRQPIAEGIIDIIPVKPVETTVGVTATIQGKKTENTTLSAHEWINSLEPKEPYALIAFGEGHLKDFIDEAVEITVNLTTGLLEIEKDLGNDPEMINDLFRYFHNLKGNSGIIGFHELNSLTHEAETLLNKVRHGEIIATHELIDLLLLVVDVIDSLVERIESSTGIVQPFDISEILACLQSAVAGENITLPKALVTSVPVMETLNQDPIESETITIESQSLQKVSEHSTTLSSSDKANEIAFAVTVQQQQSAIQAALEALAQDSSQQEYIDALYRSLTSIQNASGVMGYDELKVYAERTAGLVAQGRDSGIDFSLMLDILNQEVAIVNDMIAVILAGDGITELPAVTPHQEEDIVIQETNLVTAVDTDTNISVSSESTVSVEPLVSSENSSSSIKEDFNSMDSHVPSKPGHVVETISNVTKNIKPTSSIKSSQAKPGNTGDTATEHKSSSTIRVDHEKLDHLMNLIGELIINRNRYTMLARRLEEQGSNADIVEIAQDLSETTYAMARISDELQDTIMKVRMVPVASVFSRFPRLVRDLSRKSGKEVELILEGEETELDKSVVEVIGDPLVHLIRNSVDHGIEPENERVAQGKPIKGKVTLRAYHKGNSVAIEIEDDGKGLDPDKLREVAIKKGILGVEEAKLLDDREAMELIFAPGFSSAEKITDISGRGVGMDVVRTNIKNLKGSISIYSEIGKGTRFTLSLPLTLAIIDALMVSVAGEVFAIPLDAVSETTKLEASRLNDINGRKAVTLRGEVLGLIELSELLNLPQATHTNVLSVVIIHSNERRLGLVVDKLLERQEIVIKPLGSYLGDIPCISGATIMGDGGVILILDPHEIYLLSTSAAKSVSQ